jgi:2-polyprenyl-3-methyl-5-hydroxy-6-metoxy-1,4-benzoquinol methylase
VDAIDWHSSIAESFDRGYQISTRFIERLKVWSTAIEAYLPGGGTVLDAGCGTGVLSLAASARAESVIGFDGSEEMVSIARGKIPPPNAGKIAFEVATLSEMERFGPGSFDLVLSSSVLEYVDDLDTNLRAHAAMLKEGGTLLVSMPNGGSLYRWLESRVFEITGRPRYRRCVRHVPRPAAFEDRLRRAGLRPVSTITFAVAPVLGKPLRAAGLRSRGDTMFLTAAHRANGQDLMTRGPLSEYGPLEGA